ncbi:MAG: hypothetical protein ABIA04_05320 [Pseudomonadota bacterium]
MDSLKLKYKTPHLFEFNKNRNSKTACFSGSGAKYTSALDAFVCNTGSDKGGNPDPGCMHGDGNTNNQKFILVCGLGSAVVAARECSGGSGFSLRDDACYIGNGAGPH